MEVWERSDGGFGRGAEHLGLLATLMTNTHAVRGNGKCTLGLHSRPHSAIGVYIKYKYEKGPRR